jgi:hypothetical protein
MAIDLFNVKIFAVFFPSLFLPLVKGGVGKKLQNITRVALCSLRVNRAENAAGIVGTCLPNHCTATVAALTAANSLVRCLLHSNEQKYSYLYCFVFFNVFTESLPSNALAIHVTKLTVH